MRHLQLVTSAIALSLLACGQDPATVSATANPATFASGGTTTLSTTVTNFDLKNPATELRSALTLANEEGHDEGTSEFTNSGHYHVYLDSFEVEPIIQAYMTTQPVTVSGAPGAHKLIIQLQGEDHKIVQPPVRAEVSITLTP